MIAVRNQRIAEFQLHWSTFEKLFEDCWHSFYSYVNSLSIEIPPNTNWYSLSKYTFLVYIYYTIVYFIVQGFQSGPVPGTFTRLRSCIVPAEITEPPKISGGQNHKYDWIVEYFS